MKSVGCCSDERIPPPPNGGSPPFSREAYILLANAVFHKVTRLHQKAPEYQHYRYRQGQQPALASPRRTARHERIPPDGFDMAALENCYPQASPRGDVGIPYFFFFVYRIP